jgi:hypothetical protein
MLTPEREAEIRDRAENIQATFLGPMVTRKEILDLFAELDYVRTLLKDALEERGLEKLAAENQRFREENAGFKETLDRYVISMADLNATDLYDDLGDAPDPPDGYVPPVPGLLDAIKNGGTMTTFPLKPAAFDDVEASSW